RITHPHIQTTSNQSFRHHTNEKYAQKQHKMANLEVESDRLKKHQTPPHQQKTRNQQHKMAYKPKKHQTPPHQQKTRNQQHKMAYKPYFISYTHAVRIST
ncbi:hypothetical protein, partial [Trueperella pyogenes]